MSYDRRDRSTRLVLPEVYFPVPKPEEDFRTFERLSEMLHGARGLLDEYRRNEGAVGYAALNSAMDCSKASIAYRVRGEEYDDEEADRYLSEMEGVIEQFKEASLSAQLSELLGSGLGHALAQVGRNQKLDMKHQERVEALLFGIFWQVLISRDPVEVSTLPTIKELGCPVQNVIAGIQDLPSELATRFDEYVGENSSKVTADEGVLYWGRFLKIIRSFYLKLEEFSGIPGYVINNSFQRGSGFGSKQFRIKMLLIRQTENQNRRLHEQKSRHEIQVQLDRIEALLKGRAAA